MSAANQRFQADSHPFELLRIPVELREQVCGRDRV